MSWTTRDPGLTLCAMFNPAGNQMSDSSKRSPTPGKPEGGQDGARMHGRISNVLVVDDNLNLAENIAEIIALGGYQTAVVNSSESARDRLENGKFGAVVSDVRLPGGSGIDLLHHIRARHPDVRVILMSGYSDSIALLAAEEAGAEILSKPVEIKRLMALLDHAG